ncbi:MAG: 30S ribosome-binding factor RbfA [Candidatus Omnitrophica bacterium]|nr:30S ribosome-binding factor RbfA [Candidatus Omnitrophota bacterium]MDD5429396.1 30S ribosome-binding factor RbfA [Candidatus Omnitrophota bacterium]
MSIRMEKIDSQLRKEIINIIQEEVDDPDLDFLSITRVKTTSDLQEAKVYFSLLDETKYPKAEQALKSMKGLIRHSLGRKVSFKTLPELIFIPDESIKYSVDINKKIDEIKEFYQDHEKKSVKEDN